MKNDLFYQLALTLVPRIGCVQARILIEKLGDAKKVFHTSKTTLEKIIGRIGAENIVSFNGYARVEEEMKFIEQHHIRTLFLTDPDYPQRLLNCYDPPPLLFCKGDVNLNTSQIISVVGTRNPDDYGRQMIEKLLKELADRDILVVSGLAYGIDALAHHYALKNQLPTIGVLGHGLDSIYPPGHTALAKDMLNEKGGLLTEFFSGTKPLKQHFPARNRIVAGMCDAVVIVETAIKGGSMITAELANSYHKDVFAYPGKVTDANSEGCNYLIKTNKAMLLTDPKELIETMGWIGLSVNPAPQRELFTELTENEQKLAALLREKEAVHIDELNLHSGLSGSTIAASLLNMELQGIIRCLPGKRYKLV